MLRITGGKHKGRIVPSPVAGGVRPTHARAREAAFNRLMHYAPMGGANKLAGGRVLDLFSGSGIMAFEAISRGADSALLVDMNPGNLKASTAFARQIGENASITTLCCDCLKLPYAAGSFDIVFMDAPYDKGISLPVLQRLLEGNWLASGAALAIEHGENDNVSLPENLPPALRQLDTKKYGRSFVTWLEADDGSSIV